MPKPSKTIIFRVGFTHTKGLDRDFSLYTEAVAYATPQAACSVGHAGDIADGGHETVIRYTDGRIIGTIRIVVKKKRNISPLATTFDK